MLVCTLDGDLYPPLEEPTGTDPKSKKKDKDKDKKFVWNHGSKLARASSCEPFFFALLFMVEFTVFGSRDLT